MHKVKKLAFWFLLMFSNFCAHGSYQALDQEATRLVHQAVREGHNANLRNGLRIVEDDPRGTIYRGTWKGENFILTEMFKWQDAPHYHCPWDDKIEEWDRKEYVVYRLRFESRPDLDWESFSIYDKNGRLYYSGSHDLIYWFRTLDLGFELEPIFEHFNLKKPVHMLQAPMHKILYK